MKLETSLIVISKEKISELFLWFYRLLADFCFVENAPGSVPNAIHLFDK